MSEISPVVREVMNRYGVGPAFAATYLKRWEAPGALPQGHQAGSLEAILNLPAPFPMWFEYAMSTNARGRQLVSLISPHLPPGAKRYLGIGCGFGGDLVAFAESGFSVAGFDIDPARVELARANCLDAGLGECVFEGDILDDSLPARLGAFDAVTMIDVIEHVLDAPRALRHAAALLNPGGVALLEIPNRESLRFVAADGHFNLFGITLLDRPEAIAYHKRFFHFDYDVGDYLPLGGYQAQLAALGCECSVIGSPLHPPRRPAELAGLLAEVRSAHQRYRETQAGALGPELDAALEIRLSRYLSGFLEDYQRLADHPGAFTAFEARYLTDFWTLIARKTP